MSQPPPNRTPPQAAGNAVRPTPGQAPRPVLRGQLRPLQEAQKEPWLKVVIAGPPKSAGKTTFALSGPGKKLHLAYDLGQPPRGIPGVDESQIWTVQYAASLQDVKYQTDAWTRPRNVGEQVMADLEAIRNAFVKGQEQIVFADGAACPLPDLIVMDGMTEMPSILLDWILSVNNKSDPEEFDNKFAAWGKRLNILRNLLHMVLPLPVHVAMVAWETQEMANLKATGKIVPDIGGKMDQILPGKAEMAVRCFSQTSDGKLKFFVQIKPDGLRDWVGVRGRYDTTKLIDVTLSDDPKQQRKKGLWEEVFGPAGAYVRPAQGLTAVSLDE